ncbi:hypothetical protein INS49_013882 [Diaporthe citri]|uniref:uncharacterized protein n=1 Tax=Diaporthe citri TaxID=83186 RepID=UPI001C805A84|nr:uncharacterized protein INS49_013882 [Diaporthe citri]KAG6357999.1 hypothetical protein INS49_013882 [Diaporthe citri]
MSLLQLPAPVLMCRPIAAYTTIKLLSIIHKHGRRSSKPIQSLIARQIWSAESRSVQLIARYDPPPKLAPSYRPPQLHRSTGRARLGEGPKLQAPHRLLQSDSAARNYQKVPVDPATRPSLHSVSAKSAYHILCSIRRTPPTTVNMENDNTATASVTAKSLDAQMNDAPAQSPGANPRKRARDDHEDDAEENEDEPAEDNGESKPSKDPADGAADQPKISKNQLKKLKRQKLWEQKREDRKAIRKDKRHEKSARRRLERDERAAKIAEEQGIEKSEALKQILAAEQKEPKPKVVVPVAFILDCDFEKYMREPELVSLGAQITRSYAMNRAGQYQAHILVSSWGGYLKERFATVLQNTHLNYKGVRFLDYDFVEAGKTAWEIMHGPRGGGSCPALGGEQQKSEEMPSDKPTEEGEDAPKDETSTKKEAATAPAPEFATESIVYLSADSPNVLEKLEPYTSYVIGGLVDRNREKLLCQKRAEAKGIRTAKLPIGDYMQMASRQVLATNHVVEIMSKWLETGDWGKAFEEVIPKRKGGKLKGVDGEGEGDEENGKDAEAEAEQSDNQDDLGQKQDQQGDKQEEGPSEAVA